MVFLTFGKAFKSQGVTTPAHVEVKDMDTEIRWDITQQEI